MDVRRQVLSRSDGRCCGQKAAAMTEISFPCCSARLDNRNDNSWASQKSIEIVGKQLLLTGMGTVPNKKTRD